MSYAYSHGNRTTPARSSYRDHFVEPPSILERLWEASPTWIRQSTADLRVGRISSLLPIRSIRSVSELQKMVWRMLRRIFTIANGLIVLWLFTLWWGERTIFQESVESCAWGNWEHWVSLLQNSILVTWFRICIDYSWFLAPRCYATSCSLHR